MKSTKKMTTQLKRAAAVLCAAVMIAEIIPLQIRAASMEVETARENNENTAPQDREKEEADLIKSVLSFITGSITAEEESRDSSENRESLVCEEGSTSGEAESEKASERKDDDVRGEESAGIEAGSEKLSEKKDDVPEKEESAGGQAESNTSPEKAEKKDKQKNKEREERKESEEKKESNISTASAAEEACGIGRTEKENTIMTAPVSTEALVQEQEKPLISVRIADPDHKEIYACTSEETQHEGISDYYRTLDVQVDAAEQPAVNGAAGYSGIRGIWWALVPHGTDSRSAKKSRTGLAVNEAPSDLEDLYGNKLYRSCAGNIDPEKLVEKIYAKEKGYEESGPYLLYIWAVDFCGNGEDSPVCIPVLLDGSGPLVTVQMENGTEYQGQYYYRADNDGDSSNDRDTAAVTILAEDDRKEGGVRTLTACLRGEQTQKELTKQASGTDKGRLVFSVEDLKNHFGETEQEITVTVSASDNAGNRTVLIEEEGSRGVRLKKEGNKNGKEASFIRDAVPPCVTMIYSSSGKKSVYVYQRDRGSAGSAAFTAYTCADIAVTFEVKETFAADSLYWSISGTSSSDGVLEGTGKTIDLAAPEGAEEAFDCTAYGTDLAGNPATVRERFAEEEEIERHPRNLMMKEIYTEYACIKKGDYLPAFHLVIDRKAPEIKVIYSIDRDINPAGTAFVYDDQNEEGNVLTAYLSGKLSARAVIEENGEKLDFSRLFFADPGKEALTWEQTNVGYLPKGQDEKYPFVALAPADRDGRYFYRVYGTDRAGNKANVTELFEDGSCLEKMFTDEKKLTGKHNGVGENYISYYEIVIDTASPVVSEIVTKELESDGEGSLKEGKEASPDYYEDDGTFYYKSRGLKTIWRIDEPNYDGRRMSASWDLDGRFEEQTGSGEKGEYLLTFREEGKYTNVSVCGTDRAGNHLVLGPGLTDSGSAASGTEAAPEEQPSQNAAKTVRKSDNGGRDRCGLPDSHVELSFPRIIDRQSPVAVITHIMPDRTTGYLYPEQEGESAAALYCAGEVTTLVRVSDTYGEGKDGKTALPDGGKVKVYTMFHLSGERFGAPAAGTWKEGNRSPEILSMELRTKEEGHYAFIVEGTDRAGNPVTVRESIEEDPARGAFLDTEKGHCEKEKPHEKTVSQKGIYTSCYVIVYDKTPPVYSLSINHPSNLQETLDRKTGIAYYGRSISCIQAKFTVTDQNYDDERILAGIASKSSAGVKNMENLSPEWVFPDVRGKGSEKNGITTAIFPLEVAVDRQHEGMYRFEIAGCDKAGNALIPSSVQEGTDRSNILTDLAARTVPCKNVKGGYWTQRKAIDVTAPKGIMKVQNVRSPGETYYEIRFEAGGNLPVRYEPFRGERQARLFVEAEDCSPTFISLDLRSLDNGKDALLKKDNPRTSAGEDLYKTDNTMEVTVDGEMVFYIENLIIRDRAGNVRANDPGSSFTLAKSGNIYLDVTGPIVSEIRDAESPQIKIAASGSFTRHEGDGGRFIYRPDGEALDLEVTISDPGGRAHSSGLKEVNVEVRVGDRVVTDKIGLRHLPYTYEKGSRTGHEPLRYDISNAHIRIPAGSFAESNDITVTVRARDNSGNESVASRDGGLLKLGIDTTAPRVEVNYHDTAAPMHGRYFRADRIAEIVVIDRNVDNSSVRIKTNTVVPSFFTAPHDARDRDGAGESGNEDRWIKTLLYNSDGDYTLQISGTDALGNRISGIKWNGPAPNAFTVDKTRPVIRILLPGEVNDRDKVKYYDSPVQAVIEIREHNFTEEADTELLRIRTSVSSHSGAEAPAPPRCTVFRGTGTDVYTCAAACSEDGDYEITAAYTDPAGNTAVVADGENRKSEQEAWSGRFVVDTVAPELRLDPETFRVDSASGLPLEGMENQIYTDRDFAPRIIIRDVNYDEERSDLSVKTYGTDLSSKDLIRRDGDESRGEYSLRFNDFEVIRQMDGVYKVTAKAADLAKHQTSLEFMFSINRFGSTWVYADEATEEKMHAYYINDTGEPLKIFELSPVELSTHTVEVFKDHDRRILSEGLQYSFGTAERAAGESRSRVYLYTIAPEVYEEEGTYDFILSSSDQAGNKNSTAMFREGRAKGGEISHVKFPIELQVDKTVPVNRITGVKSGREQFNAERLKITVYPEDYQTDIRQVEVRIWKGDGKGKDLSLDPQLCLHYREIDEKEDPKVLARQQIFPIEDAGKGIPVTFEENGKWQYLEVITTDLAGNESIDLRAGDPERNLTETRRRFLVTTNPLIRFYSCKPVFYGTIPVLLTALILLALFKKRRNEGRGQDAL